MDGFPETESACALLAQSFSSSRQEANPLQGCTGALESIDICIEKPRPTNCKN